MMARVIAGAELSTASDGSQRFILWNAEGYMVATLAVEHWASGLEPWAKEMVMGDLLDVLRDGTKKTS